MLFAVDARGIYMHGIKYSQLPIGELIEWRAHNSIHVDHAGYPARDGTRP